MGAESSWVGGQLYERLNQFSRSNERGWVLPADCSYQCFPDDPDKVRRPDGSFIRRGRLPGGRLPHGHLRIVPDLVAEVVSPNDLAYEVDAKVQMYLDAGIRLVWVINPETRTARVHRADGTLTGLRENDELSGEDVIEGFRCRLADILPPVTK